MHRILSSDPDLRDPGIHVGTLSLCDPSTHEISRRLKIYSNDEVFIGRDAKRCQFHLSNPFVSNKHIRIYTILFDQDNLQEIPPLVYAQDLSLNGAFWNDYQMGKGKGSYLLSHGDILKVAVDIHIQFKSADPDNVNKFTQLQQLEMRRFQKNYVITQRMLGSGAFGRVHMAFNANTGRQFACKIVDLQAIKADFQEGSRAQGDSFEGQGSKFFAIKKRSLKYTATTAKSPRIRKLVLEKIAMQQRESLLLAELSHPNIITTEKIIRSSNTIYMFTELVTCGDLFSFIRNKGSLLEETTAGLIIRQTLLALEYLHDRNIVHRDVKPDNILMTSLESGGRVVLADFGCARLVNQTVQRMTSVVGTLEYCAPELHQTNTKGYTKAVDMWSLGCVAAVLLVGNTPFDDPCISTSSNLLNLDMDMRALEIGSQPRDFVRRLLIQDETRRMDVKQALQHDWFTNPAQTAWFKEMYTRSIQGWKPRSSSEPVIVELTSFLGVQLNKRLPSESESSWSPKEGARFADVDHISESSWENVPPGGVKSLISPAISNSVPAKKASHPSPLVSLDQNSANKPRRPQEFVQQVKANTDVKFISQIKREQIDRPKLERQVLYVPSCESPNVQNTTEKNQPAPREGKQATKAKFTLNKETGMRNFFLSPGSAAFPPIAHSGTAAPQKSSKDDSDESDQVYEEVRNPVTGKRKRLIYGRDMELLSRIL